MLRTGTNTPEGDYLIFLSLPDPETAIQRVAQRVAPGGHGVPEATIVRRFHTWLRNFHEVFQPIVLYKDGRAQEVVPEEDSQKGEVASLQ